MLFLPVVYGARGRSTDKRGPSIWGIEGIQHCGITGPVYKHKTRVLPLALSQAWHSAETINRKGYLTETKVTIAHNQGIHMIFSSLSNIAFIRFSPQKHVQHFPFITVDTQTKTPTSVITSSKFKNFKNSSVSTDSVATNQNLHMYCMKQTRIQRDRGQNSTVHIYISARWKLTGNCWSHRKITPILQSISIPRWVCLYYFVLLLRIVWSFSSGKHRDVLIQSVNIDGNDNCYVFLLFSPQRSCTVLYTYWLGKGWFLIVFGAQQECPCTDKGTSIQC